MNFCSCCGAPVVLRVPPGDSVPRHVCDACGEIHYINPKMVVGAIAEYQGKVLLCRRGIEPRRGLWTLPAGFMEMGETTADGARRETLEEACANVNIDALYSVVNVTHINQVHIFFRATLKVPEFAAGEESLDVQLFDEADVPWAEIAFRSVATSLRQYFTDRRTGQFGCHCINLPPPDPV
ncbi:MAG: NUDIX hydrolase [Rhodocyclaceae bacterium]